MDTTGTFTWYEINTTTVAAAWTWTVAPDGNSGTWNFYLGSISPANLMATLQWTRNADGSIDMTWTFTEGQKIEFHISADATSGWMKIYDFDLMTQQYVMVVWIEWYADGTGFWRTYTDGVLGSEDTW